VFRRLANDFQFSEAQTHGGLPGEGLLARGVCFKSGKTDEGEIWAGFHPGKPPRGYGKDFFFIPSQTIGREKGSFTQNFWPTRKTIIRILERVGAGFCPAFFN